MAIKHGQEFFTRWTHVENGQVLNRRLHRIELQARDGRLYVVQGEALPDFMQTCAGVGHKGTHVAQILLDPNRAVVEKEPSPTPPVWPTARDALNAGLGCLVFFLAGFLLEILS